MSRRFAGQVVLVTGVGKAGQIGDRIARALGAEGARLVVCDVNAVGVAQRAAEYAKDGLDARPAAGDLSLPDAARFAVETAVKAWGRLDLVVNVAGGLTTYGPVALTTVADLQRELAINVVTAFVVSQAAAPELAKTRGSIVNFASIAVFEPSPQMVAYTAAKGAVAGLTGALAVELAPFGVRVNAVAPGMVRTPENVAQVGEEAAYVEVEELIGAIVSLALGGETGALIPVHPRR
ncbi:MAG: SDR family NAD(P)-dependent oxidoreductase [Gemmatimonadales bacterium]|nr:SDR family NAD(P)-dependent oxidoreductase [Gemmatimonadales bacterium]